MPANDEFPRGWEITTALVGPGATPSITIPIVAGIAHVLTGITSTLLTSAAAAVGTVLVRIAGVTYLVHEFPGATTPVGQDIQTYTGKRVFPVGAALVIDWDRVVPANYNGILTVQGYDV